jgi:RimJ/RimL family protein N-acetyltransferase
MAEEWIGSHTEALEKGEAVTFAIVEKETGELCGAIALHFAPMHRRAEVGYWISPERWNRGYCTEAARAVLQYGFETLNLNRIHSGHFGSNPASGRVLEKIGMTREGILRRHVYKWGEYEDLVVFGLNVEEWRALEGKQAV